MRTGAFKAATMVGASVLLVVLALALSFGVNVVQAAGQGLPVALAAAALAGFLVELDRRVIW